MTFIYPAVLTPHKENEGYHVTFPDLVGCEADGPDLQDALENARAAAYDWVCVELEEDDPDMPEVTHEEDILLDEGSFVRQIMIIVKLLPDYDGSFRWFKSNGSPPKEVGVFSTEIKQIRKGRKM